MPLLAAASLVLFLQDPRPRADCSEWHDCRQLALDAAAAGDYERFHDLAWRTVQTGPKNDSTLMYLLARAQSLSGRPGDALVMLQRLAAMGVTTDAATNDDFRRVRSLPGWTEFVRGSTPALEASKPAAETVTPRAAEAVRPRSTEEVAPKTAAEVRPRPAEEVRLKADATEIGEPLRFETLPFTPAGLAYDAVSRRFIVGDRRARRLAVVDEFSRHVANLASAQSAGFGDIAAIEIDPRQGDLWVVSADGQHATVHKLQLVSGRALTSYTPPERLGKVDLVDIAATPENGVLVLDRAGHRLFQVRPKSPALELTMTLPDNQPTAIAPAGMDVVYLAHAEGISRVDLAAHSTAEMKGAKGSDLSGLMKLRWNKGSLVAIQREGDGYRIVRIALDRQGRGVAALSRIGGPVAAADPTAMTLAAGTLYYLAATDESGMTVRKLPLK